MNPETDPALYERPEYKAFGSEVERLTKPQQRVTVEQFITMSRKAVEVKKLLPDLRAGIAYGVVGVGAFLDRADDTGDVKEIHDLFMDLELPDAHVVLPEAADRGDFSEVRQKWDRIEELLDIS